MTPPAGGVSPKVQKEEEGMSAGQAHLPSKQQSHYGEEYGQNKEHIGGAHHRVVGQLIRLPSNLIDVEADWEYEGGRTEQDHCGRENRRALASPPEVAPQMWKKQRLLFTFKTIGSNITSMPEYQERAWKPVSKKAAEFAQLAES